MPRESSRSSLGARERVTDTHLNHIRDLPTAVARHCFANVCATPREAGFERRWKRISPTLYTMASLPITVQTRVLTATGAP